MVFSGIFMTLKERCLFLRIVENILNGKIIFPIKKINYYGYGIYTIFIVDAK